MRFRPFVLATVIVLAPAVSLAQTPSPSALIAKGDLSPGALTLASNPAKPRFSPGKRSDYEAMVAKHAKANDVPEALVHRIIVRESKYQPNLISKGNIGLMQIKLGTARGVGYTGDANGLLDANTNMTYATKYLAGAWRLADGSHDRAVSYYARGYYFAAKARGMIDAVKGAASKVKGAAMQVVSIKDTGRSKGKSYTPASPRLDELTEAKAQVGSAD